MELGRTPSRSGALYSLPSLPPRAPQRHSKGARTRISVPPWVRFRVTGRATDARYLIDFMASPRGFEPLLPP
jgi:hypothetical protein